LLDIVSTISNNYKNRDANQIVHEIINLSSHAYNRHEENEADIIGAMLLHEAGYDSTGLIDFFELSKAKKAEDTIKYVAMLAPELIKYNNAVRNLNASIATHNMYRSHQTYVNAYNWASAVKQCENKLNQIVYAIKKNLGLTNPLYLTHPPDDSRMNTVSLVRRRKLNYITDDLLMRHNRAIANVYHIVEARRPKNR